MAVLQMHQAMSLPQQKGLHPFFDKSRREPLKVPVIPTIIDSTKQHENLPISTAAPSSVNPATGTNAHDTEVNPKRRGRPPKVRKENDQAVEDGLLQNPSSNIIPAVLNNGQNTQTIEWINDQSEYTPHEAKRRKLSPAEDEGSWLEQLEHEAGVKTSGLDGIAPQHDRVENTTKNDLTIQMPLLEQPDIEVSSNAIESASMGPSVQLSVEVDQVRPLQDEHEKVLRLNGKGGFTQPVAKKQSKQAIAEVPQQLGPSVKRVRKKRSLIVVLHYSLESGNGMTSGRDRILDIINKDPMPGQQKTTRNLQVPTMVAKSTTPRKPRKITHPFFLGKASSSEAQILADRKRNAITPSTQEPIRHILKSFITPGKLKAQAASQHDDAAEDLDRINTYRQNKTFRLPGTIEPVLPSRLFQRVQPNDNGQSLVPSLRNLNALSTSVRRQKDKCSASPVPVEENFVQRLAAALRSQAGATPGSQVRPKATPKREVLAGDDIRARVERELSDSAVDQLTASRNEKSVPRELKDYRPPTEAVHPAIAKMWRDIPLSTAWDMGSGESQAWATKYAPQSAQTVLQTGREPITLKEWLSTHTVAFVEKKSADDISAVSVQSSQKPRELAHTHRKKKRTKGIDEFDDFIVNSDDDPSEMHSLENNHDSSALSARQQLGSMIRDQTQPGKNSANALLLSGPHGCGKTATIYAVAKELGFEVFEINSGARRSGKDIMDKVGNMTLNHQVSRGDGPAAGSTNLSDIDDALPTEPDEKQATLNSFFSAPKRVTQPQKRKPPKAVRLAEERVTKASRHKQSLVLLEEVDILYEDDRQFWETVLELALKSKRPIVMTCTDESVVPLKALSLHAILRLRPPPHTDAVDYMLLMAAAEGHLIERQTVNDLYISRQMDLRASITDLNFWCQMAVGAPRGGIDWYLPRWPPGRDQDSKGRKLRVISNHTFRFTDPLLGSPDIADEDVLVQVWHDFGVYPSTVSTLSSTIQDLALYNLNHRLTPHDQYALLAEFERSSQVASAVDVFSRIDLPQWAIEQDIVDATEPPLTSKALADFTQGYSVLQALIGQDFEQLDTEIAAYVHMSLRSYWETQMKLFDPSVENKLKPAIDIITNSILNNAKQQQHKLTLSRADFSLAFDPISEAPSSHPTSIANHTNLLTSAFDRPIAIITTDLAPYVRSIVQYDQQLEQQRQRLSELLSQNNDGSTRSSKRLRTTRASRSALEGGRRANTRREKWFEVKNMDYELVLRTGGRDWPKAVQPFDVTPTASMEGNSRASSIDPLSTA